MTPFTQLGSASFEALVAEALDSLPDYFREKLDNVEVVVETLADRETLRMAGLLNPMELLGFYHGIPLTERSRGYNLVLPDKISIYQRPIEQVCRTPEAIRAQVRHTVLHELAHHFGISDDRLRELGVY
jgi:predicted Zn-dependent protease with MMP-like domain